MSNKKKTLFQGVSIEKIVEGATVNLDAGNSTSYSGSGTIWYDLSGNENDGILVNGVTYDSGNKGSLVFDGVNQSINMPETYGLTEGTPYTNEIWFSVDDFVGFQTLCQFYLGGWIASGGIWIPPTASFSTYGTLFFGTKAFFISQKITTTISVDTWYQLITVYNGANRALASSYKVYLNAVDTIKANASPSNSGSRLNTIGATAGDSGEYYTSDPFKGKIAIYNFYDNKEFVQDDVTHNFEHYKDRFGL